MFDVDNEEFLKSQGGPYRASAKNEVKSDVELVLSEIKEHMDFDRGIGYRVELWKEENEFPTKYPREKIVYYLMLNGVETLISENQLSGLRYMLKNLYSE